MMLKIAYSKIPYFTGYPGLGKNIVLMVKNQHFLRFITALYVF